MGKHRAGGRGGAAVGGGHDSPFLCCLTGDWLLRLVYARGSVDGALCL